MMIALTPRIPICRTAQYFNPHFRKGSDRAAAIYRMPGKYFNPHFRKGSDGVGTVVPLDANYFNPHFRKGSDYMGQRVQWWVWHFNPHFRKGSDRWGMMRKTITTISIHTSAREVTAVWVYQVRNGCEFQSTLPQGKWQPIYWEILLILYFNPHFRKGSDSDSNHGDQQVFHFNPHFRKGSDLPADMG